MERVTAEFVRAAQLGGGGGFDWLELHCAHGYLLSAFLCPLTNRRDDDYGGSLENRCRYPLEVFRAMRAVWPARQADVGAHLGARLGAGRQHARRRGGDRATLQGRRRRPDRRVLGPDDARRRRPVYGRMYQTPFADRIRNEVGIATMAVGAIFEADHVNSIVMAGRADLCALARPHLADPYWTLHAAAQLGYDGAAVAGAVPVRQAAARAQSRACPGHGRREAGGERMSSPTPTRPLAGRTRW